MKKVIMMLCLVALITGCSEENVIDQNTDELGKGIHGDKYLSSYGDYDMNGVFVWAKDDVQFTDYYSLIDTIISDRMIQRDVRYISDGDEDVTVKWSSSGLIVKTENDKTWMENEKKWIVTNRVTIDLSEQSNSITVEAIVTFGNENKQSRRFYTLPIKIEKNVSDAFGFTYGTTIDDMAMHINTIDNPTFIKNISISGLSPVEFFEFTDLPDRVLSKLHITNLETNYIFSTCEKCKIPSKPILKDGSYRLINNPQEWSNEHLKFKLYNTTFNKLSGNESEYDYEIACLTIEKK